MQLCHVREPSGKDASSPLRNGLVDPEKIRQKLAEHKSSHQYESTGDRETLEQRRLMEELEQVKKENAVWKQQALTLRGNLIMKTLTTVLENKVLRMRLAFLSVCVRLSIRHAAISIDRFC